MPRHFDSVVCEYIYTQACKERPLEYIASTQKNKIDEIKRTTATAGAAQTPRHMCLSFCVSRGFYFLLHCFFFFFFFAARASAARVMAATAELLRQQQVTREQLIAEKGSGCDALRPMPPFMQRTKCADLRPNLVTAKTGLRILPLPTPSLVFIGKRYSPAFNGTT